MQLEPEVMVPAGEVELRALRKDYGAVRALDGIELTVKPGEFFSLLGPSGCGKTTTLKVIAGFEHPTSGELLLDGEDLVRVPPHRRPINTVFQHYALFPHLSVRDNVAFGLKRRKEPRSEITRLTGEALEMVELAKLADRMPGQLSGGEQQRVALARALVLRPEVLLLDEPLGALDANIRHQLRAELKELQREVGITFIFVTHDQEEALSLSDRIAVLDDGRIEQTGTPREIYEEPATAFVAGFVGVVNLIEAEITGSAPDGGCELRIGNFSITAEGGDTAARGKGNVSVRPERIELLPPADAPPPNCLPVRVKDSAYIGSTIEVTLVLPDGPELQATLANTGDGMSNLSEGAQVLAHLPPDGLRILPGGAKIAPAGAGARVTG